MILKRLPGIVKYFNRHEILYFTLFYPILVFLAMNLNFQGGRQNSRSEFFGDQGDYYAYLPATFIYGWDIHKFPANIEKELKAFTLDQKTGRLFNKTTCGIAILYLPFFLLAHAAAWLVHPPADGFSMFYQKMMVLPYVFYLLLGLFFLRRFLEKYVSRTVSWITVILVFAGTNLSYYTIDQGLMAHGNDFFLFSLFLYLVKRYIDRGRSSYGQWLLISAVAALAILIRPTNILVLIWLVLLDARSFREVLSRILYFLRPRYSLSFVAITFLVFIPQFIYWHYLSGSWIYYSYPGEGFTNWLRPMIIPVWFAPLNGLFLYTPMAILFVAGIVRMILKKIPNGWFMAGFFLLVSYITASWHVWYFGGSFGSRPFCEFFALFSLPFAFLLQSLSRVRNLFTRSLVILFIIASCYYNLRLTGSRFFYSGGAWAWDDYLHILDHSGIWKFKKATYTYRNDFENKDIPTPFGLEEDTVHSMLYAGRVLPSTSSADLFSGRMDQVLDRRIRKVTASLWVYPSGNKASAASLKCCAGYFPGRCIYSKEIPFDPFLKKKGTWNRVEMKFYIPSWLEPTAGITVSLQNPGKSDFIIDDLRIRFE